MRRTVRPPLHGRADYSALASQVLTTYLDAFSPRDAIASSLVTLEPSAKTTVATCVSGSAPFSIVMDWKPSSLPNAELTSLLQPPHVTPVMPARKVTSPAIAVEARAMRATIMDTILFFIFSKGPVTLNHQLRHTIRTTGSFVTNSCAIPPLP